MKKSYNTTKRVLDLVCAGVLLLVTAPIQIAVAALVARRLGRPLLFRQQRPGLHGEPFTLVKFRTMLPVDTARGRVTNEQRMTAFGRRLRALSLDELPTLWNVVRGDMSLVGPRPLRMEYLERYSAHHTRRHEVQPGVTGLAQVSGRNALDWDSRLDLDVNYVDSRSFGLDARILWLTVRSVLKKEGIEHEGHATMGAFYGSANAHGVVERPLDVEALPVRVGWLNDPRIRAGITIDFEARLDDTREWHERTQADDSRSDWVHYDRSGRPVAMCGLIRDDADSAALYLYVNPDLHGQGLGRRCLATLIDRAAALGIKTLTLETKRDNAAALALYRSAGFSAATTAPSQVDKISMAMHLRDHAQPGAPS